MYIENIKIHPWIRLAVTLIAIVGTILLNNIFLLLIGWLLIIVPLYLIKKIINKHFLFLKIAILPVFIMLTVVYGIVLPHVDVSNIENVGMLFASITTLKLILITSSLQLCLLIPDDQLVHTLRTWGIKGDMLIITLGSMTIPQDILYRADQIITARYARGLVPNRSILNRIRQVPYVIRPLIIEVLRSAVERAESWKQTKHLLKFKLLQENNNKYIQQEKPVSLITVVKGGNFSGRTHYLNSLMYNISSQDNVNSIFPEGVYIGPVPANYISGLATTVKSELELNTNDHSDNYKTTINDLLKKIEFEKNFDKNPFKLSGGEQAMLSILSKILLHPSKLAIDSTLEQINDQWRDPLLQKIKDSKFISTHIYIADNRNEYDGFTMTSVPNHLPPESLDKQLNFNNITHNDFSTEYYINNPTNLSLVNIGYRYKNATQVLKNISVNLEAGKIYHLQGINGAGKTTLSKILAGVLKIQNEGKIFVNDKSYNPYKTPGSLIGYSFQNPDEQLFSTTIEDEVLPVHRQKSSGQKKCTEMILHTFGLQDIRQEHPAEVPFVIRKRISLAATLAMDRAWYILDEPTIGQDDENMKNIGKIIKHLANYGKGVILISHTKNLINYFENIIQMKLKNGSIII